jgi:hypothetical protein
MEEGFLNQRSGGLTDGFARVAGWDRDDGGVAKYAMIAIAKI